MSVINRMLSDLERRGAPTELHSDPAMVPGRPPARSRGRALLARAFPAVLAVALLTIAATLWFERGPRLLAALTGNGSAPPPPAEPAAPVRPELVGIAFEGAPARPRLVLLIDGALARTPRYSRSGGHATLALDARSDDLSLPAPPPDQQVFRGIALDPVETGRTRLRLDVASAAGLELDVDAQRIVLSGSMPEPARPDAEAGTAAVPARTGDAADSVNSVEEGTAAHETPGKAANARAESDAAGALAAESAGGAPEADATAQEDVQPTVEREASGPGKPATEKRVAAQRTASGDTAGAGQAVRKSQSLAPDMRARRRYRDGYQALSAGELGAARRLLEEAIELDPGLHAARDLLVGLARRAGETDTARALLSDGMELAPGRVKFALPLARLLVDVGELERAAGVLARARNAGAGNAGYHALTAAVAQRRGRHEQAAREYTRALEVDAGNGLWWLGLGISLAATDHPEEARAAFGEARASGDLSDRLERWAQGRIDQLRDGREG